MMKELPLNEVSSQTKQEVLRELNNLKKEMHTREQDELKSNEEINRILMLNSNDPFLILNIDEFSFNSDIRRKYKKLLLNVFPDKNTNEKSAEAFQVVEKAYKTLLNPENRKEFNLLFEEAKSKVEDKRKKLNDHRIKRGLKVLPEDTLEEEIKEEIRNIQKEKEKENQYKQRLEEMRLKREKEEWERKIMIDNISKEKEAEWEANRDNRAREWNRFQNKKYLGKKKNPYEMKPPGYVKTEERPQLNEKTKYRSLTEN